MPESRRAALREALRFVSAGIANTAVTFVAYWVLLRVLDYRIAYTSAYALGIVLSYWLNSVFVFRTKPTLASALAYPLVYVAQYLVGLAVLWAWVSAGWPREYGVVPAIVVSIPVTFLLSRFILKRPSGRGG